MARTSQRRLRNLQSTGRVAIPRCKKLAEPPPRDRSSVRSRAPGRFRLGTETPIRPRVLSLADETPRRRVRLAGARQQRDGRSHEGRRYRLGLQSGHQTVEGLYVVEGAAAALIIVALELGEIEVFVEGLQLGQPLLQRLRRVGESGEVADPIGIHDVAHLHRRVDGGARELGGRVVEIPGEAEHRRVAAGGGRGGGCDAAAA